MAVAAVMPARTEPRPDSHPVYLDDDEDLEPPSERRSRTSARFFTAVKRRYRAQAREGARTDLDGIVAAIEGKVDELDELDEPELADAALDLAVLAMRLDREVKRGDQ